MTSHVKSKARSNRKRRQKDATIRVMNICLTFWWAHCSLVNTIHDPETALVELKSA